jgi:3-oxoacyl-[acyl-carrier protein] reductase
MRGNQDLSMQLILEGQVAAITGAARGIGLAIAERLALNGAQVAICDVDETEAEAAAEALRNQGLKAWALQVDVRSRADTDRLAEEITRRHGSLQMLVNNAGLVRDGALHKMSDENWDLVNDVIARGAFNTCRSCSALLRSVPPDGSHRKVVNIASVSGVYGRELSANYCAAKAALIGLTKALSREWAPRQINVNAIAPGFIAGTRLTTPADDGKTSMKQDYRDRIVEQIPIGREGRPDDVAALTAFLCSRDSDYITGQVIEIHGGLEILRV